MSEKNKAVRPAVDKLSLLIDSKRPEPDASVVPLDINYSEVFCFQTSNTWRQFTLRHFPDASQ